MAVGGSNTVDFKEFKEYLNPKGFKKGEKLSIERTVFKEGEQMTRGNGGECYWVSGVLEKFEKSSFQAKNGKTYDILNIELVDHDTPEKPTRYIMQMFWGGAAREIINRMASLADVMKEGDKITEKIIIGTYDTGEPNYYKGLYLKYGNADNIKDNKSFERKWSHDQYKERIKPVTVNGKTINDYTDLDLFFRNVIDKIITPIISPPIVNPEPAKNAGTDVGVNSDHSESMDYIQEENQPEDFPISDDLPF